MAKRGKLKAAAGAADSAVVTSYHRLATLCLAVLVQLALAVPATAADDSEVVIEGGGWGHGIGMSQYGAYGQALEGKSAEEIVGYYYTGSSTAQIVNQVGEEHFLATDAKPLWVGLLTNRTVFKFEAIGGTLKACQFGVGGCSFTVEPGEVWKFVTLGDGTCQYLVDGEPLTEPGICQAQVRQMSPDGAHIKINALDGGRDEFARGIVRVRTPNEGNTIHVALEIGLEEYLYGLAEVPFSWHPQALRAQVLAGRSYAAWRLISRGPESQFTAERKTTCWCQMFATTADQSYSGWANEAATGADDWQAAVNSTAGKVITHPDATQANVVAAFYSSSTGGRTENNEDMWGGSPISYLRSQADPWSQVPEVNNPFGAWEFPFTEAQLASAYGVDKVDGIEIVERYVSGTPRVVHMHVRTDGAPETIVTSGPGMFSELDLRGRNISGLEYGDVEALAGDFSGDGNADVAMVTPFNRTWWVGESTGSSFSEEPWMNHSVNDELLFKVSGDFNGDGASDVAGLQQSSGKLLVGLSNGSKFRLQKWANHIDPTIWGPLLVGDFTGDGKDDIAEYDSSKERWRVYHRKGGETKSEYWYDFSVTNPNWSSFAVGDYNGDDRDDILSLDANTGDLIVLFSDGSSFTPAGWQTLPNDGNWRYVQAADFDGNGRDDLAAYDPSAGQWWVVRGLAGTSGAAPKSWFEFADKTQDFLDQRAGDFNGDGDVDIVAYIRNTGKLKVLISANQAFSLEVWGTVAAKKRVTQILAADVDNDSKTDIIAWDNARRRWWTAKSTGTTFTVNKWGRFL